MIYVFRLQTLFVDFFYHDNTPISNRMFVFYLLIHRLIPFVTTLFLIHVFYNHLHFITKHTVDKHFRKESTSGEFRYRIPHSYNL